MTTLAPDVEFVTEGLDDSTLQCGRVECHNPAAWAYRCPACTRDRIACQGHRDLFDIAAAVTGMKGLPCELPTGHGPCEGICPVPIPWRPI